MNRIAPIFRIAVLLAAILAITTTVYAAATFGTASGPVWTNPGYQFTIPVTQLTNPDKSICLAYSVNGAAQTPVLCSCAGANCPGGAAATYTCNIPGNSLGATITWDISSYTANNGCTGKSIAGPNGSFSTGPTAVALTALGAQPQPALWLLPFGLAAAGGVVLLLLRRRAQ